MTLQNLANAGLSQEEMKMKKINLPLKEFNKLYGRKNFEERCEHYKTGIKEFYDGQYKDYLKENKEQENPGERKIFLDIVDGMLKTPMPFDLPEKGFSSPEEMNQYFAALNLKQIDDQLEEITKKASTVYNFMERAEEIQSQVGGNPVINMMVNLGGQIMPRMLLPLKEILKAADKYNLEVKGQAGQNPIDTSNLKKLIDISDEATKKLNEAREKFEKRQEVFKGIVGNYLENKVGDLVDNLGALKNTDPTELDRLTSDAIGEIKTDLFDLLKENETFKNFTDREKSELQRNVFSQIIDIFKSKSKNNEFSESLDKMLDQIKPAEMERDRINSHKGDNPMSFVDEIVKFLEKVLKNIENIDFSKLNSNKRKSQVFTSPTPTSTDNLKYKIDVAYSANSNKQNPPK